MFQKNKPEQINRKIIRYNNNNEYKTNYNC